MHQTRAFYVAMVTAALATLAMTCALPAWAQRDTGPNPLDSIANDMRIVTGKLSKYVTHEPTQKKQGEVIDKLDSLIAELERECESCRGSMANPNAVRPANDSIIRSGPGGMGDLHAARKNGKRWGELPPHERDRITQALSEGYPAHYQRILERYYRRLATEEPVEESVQDDEAASPTP